MRIIVLIIIFAFLTFFFQQQIPPIYHHSEPLEYLPLGPMVDVTTALLGPIGPDFIWLAAIQYYGEEKITGGTFEFLYDVFDVLTRVDFRFDHAYQFGSIVIAEEGMNPARAIKILRRGCIKNPSSWIPPFYIGFINYVHLKEFAKAGKFFEWASRYPDAPESSYRLSALAFKKAEIRKGSLLAWSRLYEATDNQNLKEAALRNIKYLIVEEHLELLNLRVGEFEKDEGRNPYSIEELIPEYIKSIPEEPFGGEYRYNAQADSCISTIYYNLEQIVAFLNLKLDQFKQHYGYYPVRLDELVARGLLKEIPKHPLGRSYYYREGKVIK